MNTAILAKRMSILLLSTCLCSCSFHSEEAEASSISDLETEVINVNSELYATSRETEICITPPEIDLPPYVPSEYELTDFVHIIQYRISESDDYTISWKNDELTELLDKAADIYINFFELFNAKRWNNLDYFYDENGILYYKSGVSYDSFLEYLKTIFTDDYAEYLVTADISAYENFDGELCYSSVGRGSYYEYDDFEFSIYEQSPEKIVIVGKGHKNNPDSPDEEIIDEYFFNVIYTENGWRFDDFIVWY